MKKFQEMKRQSELLKAISHPVRLCIVNGLINNNGCNVSKIHESLNLPQSTVSSHLAKLKNAGIIEGERSHKEIKYTVISKEVIKIVNSFDDKIN